MESNSDAVAERRRKKVAEALLMLAVPTARQIAAELASQGELNPATGEPWHYSTVHRDMQLVEDSWRTETVRDLAKQRVMMTRRYAELVEANWKAKDRPELRKVLRDVWQFLGLDAVNVQVFQLVEAELDWTLDRLEAAFADRPDVIERIYAAIAQDGEGRREGLPN